MASLPCAWCCTTHPTPRRWCAEMGGKRGNPKFPSVALGTAVAGILCDVASCFHSCASEEETEEKMRPCCVMWVAVEAPMEAFWKLRRRRRRNLHFYAVAPSSGSVRLSQNQTYQKLSPFTPPPGKSKTSPNPRQGNTRVSQQRGKGKDVPTLVYAWLPVPTSVATPGRRPRPRWR
ncbi:hypothetical protein BDP81DRAFT_416503 [Colletotrichum phormii]|uniref:Uncharacterized protein n=1 Tax=Colletotrichum phormii TaxID=359342 RepID=A0AAJ0A487_9PEZI|nr:uncharacterized protein BDP81DRAFT_416503 [Colletotrichum phormii]KAK1654791.1 hypothetical protein BDP81DRAFT_416503 [Colletotrichum phormii]